jgi:YD repeat-containing protein
MQNKLFIHINAETGQVDVQGRIIGFVDPERKVLEVEYTTSSPRTSQLIPLLSFANAGMLLFYSVEDLQAWLEKQEQLKSDGNADPAPSSSAEVPEFPEVPSP